MTNDLDRYEIFIKAIAGFVNNDLTATIWSWRRLDAGGKERAHGSSHISLEASFAAARRHAARFGEAPMKINLLDPVRAAPGIAPPMPPAQRVAMIAAVDRETARREARRLHALAAAA